MISEINNANYTLKYIESDNRIVIKGNLRLQTMEKYDEITGFIIDNVINSKCEIILDLTQLEILNSSGIAALGMFIIKMKENEKKTRIIGSKYISWQVASLSSFREIDDNIVIDFVVQH